MEDEAPDEPFEREGLYRFEMLKMHLQTAETGHELARNISNALNEVDRFGPHRLRRDHADELRYLVVGTAVRACESLPSWVPRSIIRRGLSALVQWIDLATLEPDERKARWERDRAQRMKALQVLTYALSLDEEVEERIAERRQDVVDGLQRVVSG